MSGPSAITLVKSARAGPVKIGGKQSLATLKAIADTIKEFEAAIGGRPALVAALSVTDLTPEIHTVLSLVGDPQYNSTSLAELCDRAKITPAEIIRAYKTAVLNRAQVIAIAAVAESTPAIVQEILRTAVPHTDVCPRCDGHKEITIEPKPTRKNPHPQPVEQECYRCKGAGSIHADALESQQDRVLQLAQLVTKNAGISITTQTQINQGGSAGTLGGGSLAQLQLAVAERFSRTPASSFASDSAAPVADGTAVPTPDFPVVDATLLPEDGHDPRLAP